MSSPPLIEARQLCKQFPVTSAQNGLAYSLTAVDLVSLSADCGETVGIAGESGCGKSTLAKMMAGLLAADSGQVLYRGMPLKALTAEQYASFRRATQMIFQDPFSSLNPRIRIGDTIAEPMTVARTLAPDTIKERVRRLLDQVGLAEEHASRFPDEFSGGQRQRIGIARALASEPSLIIADEPVSSLDISIQAQIINLLMRLQRDHSLTVIIVSHNLSVLRHMCDRIFIMYLGTVVESAPAATLFTSFRHPYTEALLAAVPQLLASGAQTPPILNDDVPSPLRIPAGCRFHPRCRYARDICRVEQPYLSAAAPGHTSACHFSSELFGRHTP